MADRVACVAFPAEAAAEMHDERGSTLDDPGMIRCQGRGTGVRFGIQSPARRKATPPEGYRKVSPTLSLTPWPAGRQPRRKDSAPPFLTGIHMYAVLRALCIVLNTFFLFLLNT